LGKLMFHIIFLSLK